MRTLSITLLLAVFVAIVRGQDWNKYDHIRTGKYIGMKVALICLAELPLTCFLFLLPTIFHTLLPSAPPPFPVV